MEIRDRTVAVKKLTTHVERDGTIVEILEYLHHFFQLFHVARHENYVLLGHG